MAGCAHGRHTVPENRLDCAGPHSLADPASGRLQGKVTNAATDEPIADLQVIVNARGLRRDTTTDEGGRWLVGDLPEGEYQVLVTRGPRTLYTTSVHLCPTDVLTLRAPIWRP